MTLLLIGECGTLHLDHRSKHRPNKPTHFVPVQSETFSEHWESLPMESQWSPIEVTKNIKGGEVPAEEQETCFLFSLNIGSCSQIKSFALFIFYLPLE